MAQSETHAVPLKRLAVMTSGGDSPGMNACIRAVVRYANHFGIQTVGVVRGYQGLVSGDFLPLGPRDVGDKLQEGGTFLRTARLPEFREESMQRQAVEALKSAEVDALVVIGGDGSLTGAEALHRVGFPVVGVPASIDNDIVGTQATIGADTALNTILEAMDRLRDTASSHGRVLIVETMGRGSGFLALMAGFSGGAEVIHIPELKTSLADILGAVERGWARGKAHVIITVAEGAEYSPHAISEYLASHHSEYECRITILGHVQRGGRPTHFDRFLASRMGAKAVGALMARERGVMIALQSMHIVTVPLAEVIGQTKPAPTRDYEMMKILAE